MRKIVALTFLSLDGVMQGVKLKDEDTSNGFQHGGWVNEYYEEVMEQVKEVAMSAPFDMLIGRKTYDLFYKYNSGEGHPFNNLKKYVITNSLKN